MIVRVLAIVFAGCATWALWAGYGQLSFLRGTPFWDFRYVVFAAAGFLGLSSLEWVLGQIKKKIEGEQDSH